MPTVMIIAEAGVNHNGDPKLARQLVESAAVAGVDAVKFQIFKPEAVISRHAAKADYQKITTGSDETQLDMVKKLELSEAVFREITDMCRQCGVRFLASPFDLPSVDFMLTLGVQTFKIPSGEITNLPYLRAIGAAGKEIILSTGMCTLGEVEKALDILEAAGTARHKISLLHCTTEYPAPFEDVNLKAMQTLRAAFPGVGVGFSDHTLGLEAAVAAVALGATIIEKHFTLDKALPGPDHRASLAPSELAALVRAIRNVEVALGDGRKKPAVSEMSNMPVARKSLVAARQIKSGERFSAENLTVKRPGHGLSPMLWDEVIGRHAGRNFDIDELIELA